MASAAKLVGRVREGRHDERESRKMAAEHRTYAASRPKSAVRRIETDVVPVGAAVHPQSRDLIAFWERHNGNGRLLGRANLPCRETAPLLPNVFVLERIDRDGEDWRLRVVGTHLTCWLDFDPTGLSISGLYHSAYVAHNAGVYRMVTEERRPHVTHGRIHGVDRDFLQLEFVHLPMEGTGPDDILLLGCISIFENRRR